MRTYHTQLGAVGGTTGGVLPVATVVARVTICHAFDGQNTTSTTHLRYEDVLVVVIEERLVVKRPTDVEGQVALRQGALVRYVLAQMGGLRTGSKGRDLWQDLRDTQNKSNSTYNQGKK
ncbi:GM20946 [Drosophila sechellia]|uniref:GM20946 n=1 Tax=Drosophila sechellia TaxID=7238 RepID=B4HQT1_DROSE|nr:GM20946 [Drosophila sechellia]